MGGVLLIACSGARGRHAIPRVVGAEFALCASAVNLKYRGLSGVVGTDKIKKILQREAKGRDTSEMKLQGDESTHEILRVSASQVEVSHTVHSMSGRPSPTTRVGLTGANGT
jgi:hypothetical protein